MTQQYPEWDYIEDEGSGLYGLERFLDYGNIAADVLRTFDEEETWCWMIRIFDEDAGTNHIVASYDDDTWFSECGVAYDACMAALDRLCPEASSTDSVLAPAHRQDAKRSFLSKVVALGMAAALTLGSVFALTGCAASSHSAGDGQPAVQDTLMGGRYVLIDTVGANAEFGSGTTYVYEDTVHHTVWYTTVLRQDMTYGRTGGDLTVMIDENGTPVSVDDYEASKADGSFFGDRYKLIDTIKEDSRIGSGTTYVYEDTVYHTVWFATTLHQDMIYGRTGGDLTAIVDETGQPLTVDEYWATK